MRTLPFLEESGYDIPLIQCHNQNGGLSYSCCYILSIFVSGFGTITSLTQKIHNDYSYVNITHLMKTVLTCHWHVTDVQIQCVQKRVAYSYEHQCNRTNKMHDLLSVMIMINSLYIFRAPICSSSRGTVYTTTGIFCACYVDWLLAELG
jgi:hypothetical protein